MTNWVLILVMAGRVGGPASYPIQPVSVTTTEMPSEQACKIAGQKIQSHDWDAGRMQFFCVSQSPDAR